MDPNRHNQPQFSIFEAHSVSFVFSFVLIFIVTALSLNILGLTPELISESTAPSSSGTVHAQAPDAVFADAQPIRIVIESVGIDVGVIEPASKDIDVLDKALLEGAVHYPGSGNLADNASMFIFGHSSRLPSVQNKNFQAFNDLEHAKPGDIVRVESTNTANLYRVVSVKLVSAQEALIPIGGNEKRLVLSTCNSFGKPSDRYVLEADFVASYPLNVDGNIDK